MNTMMIICIILNIIVSASAEARLEFTNDYILNNRIFYTLYGTETLYQCAEHCALRNKCLSFNFKRTDKVCHLNTEEIGSLQRRLFYVHCRKRDIPRGIYRTCWNHTCPNDSVCLQTQTSNGYTCVREDIPCNDINVYCSSWIQSCQDTGNRSFVKFNCRKSCKTCHFPSPISQTTCSVQLESMLWNLVSICVDNKV